MGNSFVELSIIVDKCVELLAVGGLVLMNGGPVEPFLGSSIKPINKARIIDGDVMTKNILVRENADVTRTARLLRQCYKRDSFKQCSFHLNPAYDVGFYPVNPLQVNRHPSVSSVALTFQSALLRMYCKKAIDQNLLANLFRTVCGSTIMKTRFKVDSFDGNSFEQLYDAMTIAGKWKTIVGIVRDLESERPGQLQR
ncbi:hypothetical protein MUCCIDRAFT_83270 [Mucor lusitanicus CBS 277.49]|uniref:Uncharacterized protein n=2 Tax=Mucor circinelloides f. lusitanicus TaxID=29924 RepID=A0A162QF65_MUCCL|nr:hypothetical protein MUCCIDRAFT_83270 [Mucor lusitanicus CBS 277.49]